MPSYTTERRRAARMKLSPERRREIGQSGGRARMAGLSPAQHSEMSKRGVQMRMIKVSPERRREVASIGARASNAARTKEQHSAWSKMGGYPSHRSRKSVSA